MLLIIFNKIKLWKGETNVPTAERDTLWPGSRWRPGGGECIGMQRRGVPGATLRQSKSGLQQKKNPALERRTRRADGRAGHALARLKMAASRRRMQRNGEAWRAWSDAATIKIRYVTKPPAHNLAISSVYKRGEGGKIRRKGWSVRRTAAEEKHERSENVRRRKIPLWRGETDVPTAERDTLWPGSRWRPGGGECSGTERRGVPGATLQQSKLGA
ncbi:uncharacterized protein LOC133545087 isoform X1 [Nerophis ophidion]|uniref:uncharacterized protein LOC133545087 isoform X1 n=1 Tax=Nerophis ophidion TaxID=159077 RepID=UPI002ADF2EED|nr:uncharacterized protein LOC133545087 isoform X1 [Nerophis ophidion]